MADGRLSRFALDAIGTLLKWIAAILSFLFMLMAGGFLFGLIGAMVTGNASGVMLGQVVALLLACYSAYAAVQAYNRKAAARDAKLAADTKAKEEAEREYLCPHCHLWSPVPSGVPKAEFACPKCSKTG